MGQSATARTDILRRSGRARGIRLFQNIIQIDMLTRKFIATAGICMAGLAASGQGSSHCTQDLRRTPERKAFHSGKRPLPTGCTPADTRQHVSGSGISDPGPDTHPIPVDSTTSGDSSEGVLTAIRISITGEGPMSTTSGKMAGRYTCQAGFSPESPSPISAVL